MERARNSQLCVTCHFQIFIVHCVYLHKNDYFIRHRFRPIVRLYFFDYSDNSIIRQVKLTQVAKNHFAFATALLWHQSIEITLKLYLYGKYSIQTMIFWSLCAFIWFKNIKKMLLQMASGFLQLESTIGFSDVFNPIDLYK
jgi:hypothetical protein